jgi:hypothetical protein
MRADTRRSLHSVAWKVAACATAAMLLGSACTYYQAPPPSYPAPPSPSTFDRAWDAAVGAAYDEGVQVTVQDRGSGLIRGTKGNTNVVFGRDMQYQPAGSLCPFGASYSGEDRA